MNPIVIVSLLTAASPFLNSIGLPAAEELGLILKDRVILYRAQNLQKMLDKAQRLVTWEEGKLKCNPRVGINLLEKASLCEDDLLQNMWAGLLIASCTPDGKDDTNLIYINTLDQMTSAEARILNYICENSTIETDKEGTRFINSQTEYKPAILLIKSGISDKQILLQQLNHMDVLGLFPETYYGGEFNLNDLNKHLIAIAPSSFALELYFRAKGNKI